jgi:uncharacterized protein YjiS (DUF1127 family)
MVTNSARSGGEALLTVCHLPLLRQWLQTVIQNCRRRARLRRELAMLSDFEIKDLGYPSEIGAEKIKPLWQH